MTLSDIQWHSVTLSDIQWHSVTLSDIQWHSVTFSDIQWHSMTLCDIQWHSVTFNDTQWHSMTLSDIQWHPVTFSDIQWTTLQRWHSAKLFLLFMFYLCLSFCRFVKKATYAVDIKKRSLLTSCMFPSNRLGALWGRARALRQSDQHWNCFKGNIRGNSRETGWSAYGLFPSA